LNVGRLEAVMVVQAPFNDPRDYASGFDLSSGRQPLRTVLGSRLACSDDLFADFLRGFRKGYADFSRQLTGGDYVSFVQATLHLVDGAIGHCKSIYGCVPRR
jgi:hypothetical protein